MEVPIGATAKTVIADYLNAVGGSKLNEIKSVSIYTTANLQGMELITELSHMAPKSLKWFKLCWNIIMQSVFDGEKGVSIQQGQKSHYGGHRPRRHESGRPFVP